MAADPILIHEVLTRICLRSIDKSLIDGIMFISVSDQRTVLRAFGDDLAAGQVTWPDKIWRTLQFVTYNHRVKVRQLTSF